MTDNSDAVARARRAYQQSIDRGADGFYGPVHPSELARLERALLLMPRRTREIFLAHRLDNLSYSQITAATGLSERRVERRMASAISHLDRALRSEERGSRWCWWWPLDT